MNDTSYIFLKYISLKIFKYYVNCFGSASANGFAWTVTLFMTISVIGLHFLPVTGVRSMASRTSNPCITLPTTLYTLFK